MAELKLFHIACEPLDGGDQDLMVWATTPAEAFELWGEYFFRPDWAAADPDERLELHGLSGELLEVAAPDSGSEAELRIFEVCLLGDKPRFLPWNDAAGLRCVAKMEAV